MIISGILRRVQFRLRGSSWSRVNLVDPYRATWCKSSRLARACGSVAEKAGSGLGGQSGMAMMANT
jgi:hypothetical protein